MHRVGPATRRRLIPQSKAADQGLAGTRSILASSYEDGRGVPQDPAEAARWRALAGFDER